MLKKLILAIILFGVVPASAQISNPVGPGATGGCSGACSFSSVAVAGATIGGDKFSSGVVGNATTSVFNGLVGVVGGTGNGIVGVGHAAIPGYAMWVDAGSSSATDNELIAMQGTAAKAVGSAATGNSAAFGGTFLGTWGGSASSPLAYTEGIQATAQVTGTASIGNLYAAETACLSLATGGTVTNCIGNWAHVDSNAAGGSITNAYASYTSISGASHVTNAWGYFVNNINNVVHAVGLGMNDITGGSTDNYAIKTGLGLVSFGDVLSAPSATIPILNGTVTIGSGGATGSNNSLTINAPAAQSVNLMTINLNGAQRFALQADGGTQFRGDMSLNSNTLISNSAQAIRLGSDTIYGASSLVIGMSSTTHSYDTIDTAFSRDSAGIWAVGANSTPGNKGGSIKLTSLTNSGALIAAGSVPTLTGTCTTASQTGGNTVGTFTATCVSQTVIITFATTAPNGWSCNAHDQTTPADALSQSANSTTSCTLTGTTVALDRVVFDARAF